MKNKLAPYDKNVIEYLRPINTKVDFIELTSVINWRVCNENNGLFFYSPLWEYDDSTKTPMEISNFKALKKLLDFHNIRHAVLNGALKWSSLTKEYSLYRTIQNYKNIVIPVHAWRSNRYLFDLIAGLKNYPVIDEYDYCELVGSLEEAYMKTCFLADHCKNDFQSFVNVTRGQLSDAYYDATDTLGYGIVWWHGCKADMHKDLVDEVIKNLNNKGHKLEKKASLS